MHFGLRLLVLLPLCILHLSAPLHSLAPGKLIKSRLCGIFMHEIFIKFLWFRNASKLKTRRDEITSHLINRSDCKDAKIKNDLQGPIVGFGEVKYFLSAGVSIKRHVGVSKWMYFNVLMISQEMIYGNDVRRTMQTDNILFNVFCRNGDNGRPCAALQWMIKIENFENWISLKKKSSKYNGF